MQASPEYNPEGNPEQTTAVHAVAVPHPSGARQSDGVGVMDSKSTSDGTGGKRRVWPWLLGLVVLAVTLLSIVVLRTRQSTDSKSAAVEAMPTNAPTSPGDEECLKKRVKIKQVCNVPGLDDKLVEMKVLVDDKLYWPRNVRADCTAEYGSDGTSCVVPESTLSSGCVVLKNSREIAFGGPDGAAVTERIKVTIMDEDFFWDDVVDVFVPKEDWHRPNLCEKKEIEVAQSSRLEAAKVVLGIDFGEVQNACGVDEKVLSSGLTDAAVALQNVQEGLVEYVRGLEGRALRRKLIFPLLASGFRLMASGGRSFVRLFTRQSRVSNVLSTAADMTEIGSFILSFFGDDDEAPSVEGIDNQALFDRFDQIDSQLENIQLQIQDGLDEIKLVVEQEFAEQELDEWVKFRLGVRLRGDYKAYTDRRHTKQSRVEYEEKFRATCNGDYSPYNIFQVLYSYSCLDCRLFTGKAKQYFLDTYVNLAKENFETPMERVLWFRRSFGTVIVGALTEAVYLYSACLHRNEDECDVIDPVRDARLEEMGDGLEEVITSLGEAEERIE